MTRALAASLSMRNTDFSPGLKSTAWQAMAPKNCQPAIFLDRGTPRHSFQAVIYVSSATGLVAAFYDSPVAVSTTAHAIVEGDPAMPVQVGMSQPHTEPPGRCWPSAGCKRSGRSPARLGAAFL